jgi:hypothetical protein
VRAAHRDTDHESSLAKGEQLREHLSVIEHAGVWCGRVDLVEAEVTAEQGSSLGELASKSTRGVILDLVDVGVHSPSPCVAVAPLGSHGHRAGWQAAPVEPRAQELLRAPIGAGDIEVAEP